MKLSNIKSNPDNPRIIKDEKFKKLVKSIKEFPEMIEKRPLVCVSDKDGKIYPLGGNMRFKALQELQYKDIPDNWIVMADDWNEEKRKEFVIKDNIGYGEWSYDDIANYWDVEQLSDWGLDIPDIDKIDNLDEDEEIEFEQSVQLIPPKEYILIMADPNSVEWEEMKESLKLKMVKRGGYKDGSPFQAVSLERVLLWNDFKLRMNVNSSTK